MPFASLPTALLFSAASDDACGESDVVCPTRCQDCLYSDRELRLRVAPPGLTAMDSFSLNQAIFGKGSKLIDQYLILARRSKFLQKVFAGDPVAIGFLVFGFAVAFGFPLLKKMLFKR